MKKSFSGFYSPSNTKIKNAWKHEKTLFVFDTNVLLNLYSYTEDARDDFFKILDRISDNIWLPHHVGLEYQRNRLEIIKNEKGIFKKLNEDIARIKKTIESNEKSKELQESMKKPLEDLTNIVNVWNDKQPEVRSGDKIRPKIEESFNDKIGVPFLKQEELDKIYKDGEKRYKNEIPPGFKDAKDKKDKPSFSYGGLNYVPMYGDLIIWNQIIEHAKKDDIKSVFLITDDTKEDWWYIIDSSGKKRIGVRAELREEIEREAKISLFDVMTTSSFMEDGKKYLELDVSYESIEEVEDKSNYFINLKKIQSLQDERDRLKSFQDSNIHSKLARAISSTQDFNERKEELFDKVKNARLEEQLSSYQFPPNIDKRISDNIIRINKELEDRIKNTLF